MISAIDKATAHARLSREIGAGKCALCELASGRIGDLRDVLVEDERVRLVLTQYPTRWGHLLVVAREHVVSFAALDDETHRAASALALRAARALERALCPARVYVASLGTAEEGLPMTTPHFHLHVVPVADPQARPRDVLTWENGVCVGEPSDWSSLRAALLDALDAARQ